MSAFRFVLFVLFLGLGSSCMDQYKPFTFWKKIEEERIAAKNNGKVYALNGDRKYLDDQGILQVEAAADKGKMEPETADSIYASVCAVCHDADGAAKANPALKARDFTDGIWQDEASDAEIALVIKVGTMAFISSSGDDSVKEAFEKIKKRKSYTKFQGTMPPSGAKVPAMTDEQIQEMVKKIRSFR